ncbi:multidrug ABC transporter ATP-binding protein [Bacillus coahuilensis p1.1.43]|uniref:Multidrug ABC transporter ATP-binding protein n=1 Tax=Bacillus coahuilensis p1.1.43 TaxID=1150625 RepID=A0A147K982_9BACI|nr:ABC transporter transmembrane domain-containing protein [Bacillus coahuilensis]KUP06827.1 multidrug ABC transporter ATP-binding protein [Bacillus coahuilensis p1.1.43]
MNKQEELSPKHQRGVFLRLMTYAIPHKKSLVLAFVLLLLATLGEVAGPLLVKVFIDDYLSPKNFPFTPLILLSGVYISIQVLNSVVSYFQLVKFQEIALKIIQQLRIDVFSKVQNLGMSYFDKTPAGSIVSRVTNDTEAIKDMFVSVLVTFIQSSFLMIGIFIAMFSLNRTLGLICIVLLPIILLIIRTYRKLSSIFYSDMRERLSELNAKLSESIQGMKMIQAFRQEDRLVKEFSQINGGHYESGLKNIKVDGLLLRPAMNLLYVSILVVILNYFGVTHLQSGIEIGVLYAFVSYIDRFFEPVNQIMMRLSLFQQAIVSASRVFKLLDEKELSPQQENKPFVIEQGTIEFKNVSFSYDGKKDVLKSISFKASPGQTIALVGHTGSGKSSIINLFMRFYEFDRGDILIDGISIKEYPLQELRQKVGLVLQDPFLFYGTIMDNIKLYNETITDDRAKEALTFVEATSFVESLPGNYLHKVEERGSTFSSGQRQLLAFARTMAVSPSILVLDEATANIDTETEELIQSSLKKMRYGRTTIAIAHRLSTIQDADEILVLHKGEIVERGNHQQLLTQEGLYYNMYLLQNKHKSSTF